VLDWETLLNDIDFFLHQKKFAGLQFICSAFQRFGYAYSDSALNLEQW